MGILLRDLGWHDPVQDRWWLRRLSARVTPRRTLGLRLGDRGEGGRRRVALLGDLVTGVLRPTAGLVAVAGVDLERLDADTLAAWRRSRVWRHRTEEDGMLTLRRVQERWRQAPELFLWEGPTDHGQGGGTTRVAELLRWMRHQRRCTSLLVGGALPAGACDVTRDV